MNSQLVFCSPNGQSLLRLHRNQLLYGQTLNLNLYCQQLDRQKEAIAQECPALAKRRALVLHQKNAIPHTTIVPRQKLSCEILMNPYYFFCLQLHLNYVLHIRYLSHVASKASISILWGKQSILYCDCRLS